MLIDKDFAEVIVKQFKRYKFSLVCPVPLSLLPDDPNGSLLDSTRQPGYTIT